MSKSRPYIPPPKLAPPEVSQTALPGATATAQTAPDVPRGTTATIIALVPPPARIASVKILPDRIEYTNPTIELLEFIMPTAGDPKQTKRLTPDRAVVAHGMLVIDEMHLSLPLSAFLIRT